MFEHLIDGGVEYSDIRMDVDSVGFRLSTSFIKPAFAVGVGAEQCDVVAEGWVPSFEVAVDDAEEVGDGFETLNPADASSDLDGFVLRYFELEFDEFSEHAGGKLGEADPVKSGLGLADPEVSAGVKNARGEPGGKTRALVADALFFLSHDPYPLLIVRRP